MFSKTAGQVEKRRTHGLFQSRRCYHHDAGHRHNNLEPHGIHLFFLPTGSRCCWPPAQRPGASTRSSYNVLRALKFGAVLLHLVKAAAIRTIHLLTMHEGRNGQSYLLVVRSWFSIDAFIGPFMFKP